MQRVRQVEQSESHGTGERRPSCSLLFSMAASPGLQDQPCFKGFPIAGLVLVAHRLCRHQALDVPVACVIVWGGRPSFGRAVVAVALR